MSIGTWFWAIYVLCLLLIGVGFYRADPNVRWYGGGSWLVMWVLVGLLGWHAFGGPVK